MVSCKGFPINLVEASDIYKEGHCILLHTTNIQFLLNYNTPRDLGNYTHPLVFSCVGKWPLAHLDWKEIRLYLINFMIIWQHREPSFASELRTANNYRLACTPRNIKFSGICFTDLQGGKWNWRIITHFNMVYKWQHSLRSVVKASQVALSLNTISPTAGWIGMVWSSIRKDFWY